MTPAYRTAKEKIEQAYAEKAKRLDLGVLKASSDGVKLTRLPDTIGRLSELEHLSLVGHALSTLPESISRLVSLRTLELGGNRFESLPESIGELQSLETLELSGNILSGLPSSFAKLRCLRNLTVVANRFTTVPQCLRVLNQLTSLNFASSNLLGLPEWFVELHDLQVLWLYNNLISQLPDTLGKLSKLRELSLGDNRLSKLPDSVGDLSQLELLVLDKNDIQLLPRSMVNLRKLRGLFLHENDALGLAPEILGPTFVRSSYRPSLIEGREQPPPRSPEQILEYYFRTRRGRRPLNEAKLILVGRGGVGKTCLIKRLIRNTFDEHEPETPGIEIQPWEVSVPDGDRVRLHVWDFGGQEILHATHQFFLTERTVYLLVLSGREGTATHDAEYWLQLIRSFGGTSPVIVALNKSEQHPFDVNRGLLLEKYSQIVAFIRTDCQRLDGDSALGIRQLHELILGATFNLEHRKTDFPADWFEIKERLAAMKENFLAWDRYQEICRSLGEQDTKAQRDLAGFLHILGIALNYRDDPRLRETHVLNPRWVTEGIYSILRSGQSEQRQRKGVLEIADLARALNSEDYPATAHEFLLALMQKFQLCFQLPGGERRYLVPELLGENQPEEIATLLAEPGLAFRYQYEILPEGLLPRFIVQTHVLSEPNPNWRWRTGVVLSRDGCRAIVRADARERRVDIHISGPERQRRDLLAIVRERFDEQHRDLKGLNVDERVPIPSEPGVTVSYTFLIMLEDEGEIYVRPEGAKQKHRIADLLNGIEEPARRLQRRTSESITRVEDPVSKKHIFLSYCHDNQKAAERLRDDLLGAGESVWWDEDILPGQDWKLAIDQAMKDAYAVVLCLSTETAARTTTGIYPEANNAIGVLREYAPGSVFLIPVRFSACTIPPIEIDATRRLDRLQFVDLFPPNKREAGLKRLISAIESAANHPSRTIPAN